MALEVTTPIITFFIIVFAISGSIVPAFEITNRYLRDEPKPRSKFRGIGIMLFFGSFFAAMITVNGVATSSYSILSATAIAAFLMVLIAALLGMIVLGVILAYPLHLFLKWEEPPEIVQEYRP